ncbi:NadR-like transcriptional regulator [Formosa agariphila KMM 3901]|uniref:NadR-like transcriptional regulator n=1 Tax=Formosa agariphila (strain DSM 15362 / KCTC 12365 / LMG 23005 / KMM 3901 / M-2Alg 35-1) TaxID=1347342 RepID=T2KQD1_FORAG|nr:NadR-like transcriptional regulator [Formosa agariphila KMM 3901]
MFGPESTGKTVLAKQLAEHYNTIYVPEFSRTYALEKNKTNDVLTEDDVIPIAKGQMFLENELTKAAKNLLICDTNLLETKVYAEVYYKGFYNESLTASAIENHYNLYFLTYIDIPWEADEVRDKPNERETMFNAFKKALNDYNKPYVLLKGTFKERFDLAVKHIDKLILEHA